METKQTMRKPEEKCAKERYVSCVRINGVPILPPLITPEKCAAIKYYRKQAMKIEKQVMERKRARAIRQAQYYIPPTPKVHTVDQTKFTENILDCCRNIESFLSATYNIDSTDVEAQKHAPKLTCDIQASQYINNELVLFDSKTSSTTNPNPIQQVDIETHHSNKFSTNSGIIKKVDLDEIKKSRNEGFQKPWLSEIKMLQLQSSSSNASPSRGEIKTLELRTLSTESFDKPRKMNEIKRINSQQSDETTNKPRDNQELAFEKPQLIRSNSYVLETPSPVLIEHLKKTNTTNLTPRCWSSSDNLYTSNSKTMPNNECDDRTLMESLKSFSEHGKLPVAAKADDSISNFDTSCTETELKNISDNESQSCISDNEYKLKQFIDNNVPKSGDTESNSETITINNENDTSKNEVPCESFDSLKEILKNIPEKYSKQILEFLDKHNRKNEDFGIPQKFSTPNEDRGDSVIPTTPNQTVYYSVDDDSKIGDYLYKASQELQVSRELQYTSLVIYESDQKVATNNAEVTAGENDNRYEKAASIIGAAVKGYLTRRLLHTEKVQNLIDVIKEVLVCAVQLHSENLDCIDEYDVELHRRLIQQVSAACYAFHDIFFNTSTAEQMSIISMDRQKKIEKLRRPLSSLSIHSAKSTPRKSTKASLSSRSMPAF